MSDVVWVFPGQGSQKVGMGKELAEKSSIARNVFNEVDRALGFDLSRTIFEGPSEELLRTTNQQPAILAASVAYLRVLRASGELPEPGWVAGHSLGEYSALVAAGAMSLADAARLVRRRGELMEEHGLGGMVAVLGLDATVLENVARETGTEIANFNAPGQITLSGRADGLEAAGKLAKEQGARRVLPLPVNGAFHSSLMEPVAEALWPMIAETTIDRPSVPLIANVDGRAISEPDELRAELRAQITASVRWIDVVQSAAAAGACRFYEVGPGKVLSGLIGRILPNASAAPVEPLLASLVY
ncbi:MAG TPA: ACP S-malonyltransferase [Thermomicrobiaceae bacterium]|nr:ACP S-malonyltransferase [Thermomicrobiaceae bacterium]